MYNYDSSKDFNKFNTRVEQRYLYSCINFLNNVSVLVLLILLWSIAASASSTNSKIKRIVKNWDRAVKTEEIRDDLMQNDGD